ncbi:DUF3086 domain-containing protein [Pseudanabaena sp. PCC 6802]|uniref:DUF3086 domain-containing protein n=1 Tax=Pseudanabaena sp. PCC 6802 TaxID=118173 RepID=UPI00036D67A8|nr:DUF3086 domain-containing protein [Pseudanabaena sp. PCC 6802]
MSPENLPIEEENMSAPLPVEDTSATTSQSNQSSQSDRLSQFEQSDELDELGELSADELSALDDLNELINSAEPIEAPDTSSADRTDTSPELALVSIPESTTLQQEADRLKAEIELLKTTKQEILEAQVQELQAAIVRATQDSLGDLEKRQQELQASIALLQRKQERLQNEMKTTYAGASQDIAVRVQGFKDYLVGSLQDLVASAEKLELVPPKAEPLAEPVVTAKPQVEESPMLAEQAFESQKQRIEQLLERYRTLPDYYGPPWKLRRTFEQVHADRVANWFLAQAGRGAIRSMGTRLQNILVAAAVVSVLRALYADKVRILVLATSPERLGEWRRGFQDCLGIGRDNFGPEKGVVLFEDPDPLSLKGDRLVSEGLTPLVIIDEAEEYISVDLLRFPLILAYGRDPQAKPSYASRDKDRDRDFRDF